MLWRVCAVVLIGIVLSGVSGSCSHPRYDEGSVTLFGDAQAMVRLFERSKGMGKTPLTQLVTHLSSHLAKCRYFSAEAPPHAWRTLADHIRCQEHTEAGAGQVVFHIPLPAIGRLEGQAFISESGELQGRIDILLNHQDSAWAMMLPAQSGPDAAVLGAGTLAHWLWKTQAPLDLASFVPKNGQLAQMFGLKEQLFSRFVLGRQVELSVYEPRVGKAFPDVVIAVAIQSEPLAAKAMNTFLSAIEARWKLRRTPFIVEKTGEGACFQALRLLPELTPCYLLMPTHLVFGWNRQSVWRALDGDQPEPPVDGKGSYLVVHLDRFSEADRALTLVRQRKKDGVLPVYPFAKIRIDAHARSQGYRLDVQLVGLGQ